MIIERRRDNVFNITATSQEIVALVAGARLALDAMKADPRGAPPEALAILERVIGEFDRARDRMQDPPAGG